MKEIEHEYAIRVRGLRKNYGRVEALRGVDLDVRRGHPAGPAPTGWPTRSPSSTTARSSPGATAAQLKQGVGRERVSVVLSGPEDFHRADDLLVGPGLTHDPETRTISLAIDGPSRVKHLLDLLAEHGLAIDSLSLTKPTLDDVFFALTQRASDPPDADSMPARREPNDELGALR